jgi:predicted Zn-dependent protease
MTLYRTTLRLNPDHFGANLMLGRLLAMQHRVDAALPYLRKAVGLEPASVDAHRFLANAYLELGQNDNARRERAEADRLSSHP